jgi:hypothetical protein
MLDSYEWPLRALKPTVRNAPHLVEKLKSLGENFLVVAIQVKIASQAAPSCARSLRAISRDFQRSDVKLLWGLEISEIQRDDNIL